MKKLFPVVLLVSVFFADIHGNEAEGTQNELISQKHPHNIYFGPEAFCFDLNTQFNGVKIDGAKFFIGLKLGYEYFKPKAFYFGIDILGAGGNHGFNNSYQGYHFPKNGGTTGFGNIELRFGYVFAPGKVTATPFLGIGGYSFGYGTHHYHFDESFSYITGGVRSKYEFNPRFSLGFNFKIFASIYTEQIFRLHGIKQKSHHGLWGGEAGVPFIWYIGSSKRWDIQLEPYFLSLKLSEKQNIYGTRLLFDYRF